MYRPSYTIEKAGSLEVICGPMFSGKSEELIRRLRRATIAKQKTAVFKHALDNHRSDSKMVVSHNGTMLEACATVDSYVLFSFVEQHGIDVVGIDEIQFFEHEIISIVSTLVDKGKRVIVAGLDTDFRGAPFGPMPILLALADSVSKLQAICTECGDNAMFTQRLVDGKPARLEDPLIVIGRQEAYQARCRGCYRIDQKPELLRL